MKLLYFVVIYMVCTMSQALSVSSLASVSLILASLNTPVYGFFGMFRRRVSPPIQETIDTPKPPSQVLPGQFAPGRFFQPFGGFGGSGYFFPGFNTPSFGMFGQNRFPPQFRPPQQMKNPQRPQPQFPLVQMQQAFPPQQIQHTFPPQMQQAFQPQQKLVPPVMGQFPPQGIEDIDMHGIRDPRSEDVPGMNTEEAESFFTLLAETDESKCISRLVCEMGANPESGGEFGQTIVEIIGSLNDFPDGSKVSEYNEVLNLGLTEGLSACMSKFSMCDEESYQLVRNAQTDEGQ